MQFYCDDATELYLTLLTLYFNFKPTFFHLYFFILVF